MNGLVITAPPPVTVAIRDGAPPMRDGTVGKATPVETARAPRPVDASGTSYRSRGTGGRDQPVGPPPTFAINVLQDILSRLADPAPAVEEPPLDASAAADRGSPERRGLPESAAPAAAGGADPARSLSSPAVSAERNTPPRPLDRKV